MHLTIIKQQAEIHPYKMVKIPIFWVTSECQYCCSSQSTEGHVLIHAFHGIREHLHTHTQREDGRTCPKTMNV